MDTPKYVAIEGWHQIAENEMTVCGLVIPYPSVWVNEVPAGETIHCGVGAKAEKTATKKAPAKRKAKAK